MEPQTNVDSSDQSNVAPDASEVERVAPNALFDLRPPSGKSRRLSLISHAALVIAGCMLGGETDATEFTRAVSLSDDDIRIQEVFTSHLPDTTPKSEFHASIHPRFGDLLDGDYIQLFTGVRYGLTERLEVSGGVDSYFGHGLGDVGFLDDAGLSGVAFGAKLNVGQMLMNAWHSSIGFEARFPVGHPPPEFTDGLKHLMPYVTFSRRLDSNPDFRVFWGIGLDLVDPSSIAGVIGKNQLDDDTLRFSGGVVWDRGYFHYLFETHWDTTRVIGDTDEDVLTLRPGIIWEVPSFHDHTKRSGLLVGVAAEVAFGPDGTNIGTSAKLRYNFDLKRLFRGKPSMN